MALAFGHLIGAWICGKTYEFMQKKKIPQIAWFFLLFGGILPDIDFIVEWMLQIPYHRTFTHSILFVLVMSICLYLILKMYNDQNAQKYSFVFAIGICIHIFIDMFSSNGVQLLWPSPLYFSFFKGITQFIDIGMFSHSSESIKSMLKLTIFDMGLGTTWLFGLWYTKSLRF
jgi:membrane-bound metal-dependent hydrolase YbcI (DUF457 family)